MIILFTLFQVIVIMAIAPFAMGLIRFTKARLQGRHGASPFLPYYTFATLLRKQMVISTASSWVFRAAPFIVLVSSIFVACVLPLMFSGGSFRFASDFLVVSGILAVGSIFLVLGGLDTGSAFGGMGSSREMTIASLLEPTIIMIFATLAVLTGTTNIDGMIGHYSFFSSPALWLSAFSFILVSLAENARYPVDNPATHLELTMVHEAMILEYSGPYLAMMEYASALKLTVFSVLLTNIIFPSSIFTTSSLSLWHILSALLLVVLKVSIVAILLGLLETTIVKMRFYRMQEYLTIAFITAFFGMITVIFARLFTGGVQYYLVFAVLSIISVILLFGRVRFRPILWYYAISSFSIAGVAYFLPVDDAAEKTHLAIFALATIAVKCAIVPMGISYAHRKNKINIGLATFLRPASSYFLATGILIASYFALSQIKLLTTSQMPVLLYAALVMAAMGLAIMTVHRNVFSQIIGLLVVENGIAIFTLVTVKSLPLLVELGVFAVTVTTAAILSMLSQRVGEFHGSHDTEKLRNLTE